ncbi:protein FAR-RED IMPAIRED RESPONSE 1-like [Pistacia vera]|uniref:protein FAR-RED IMPAIRED RESPONSE 1-like n=1 Tax=Pistacia vera TaxID=55513 RepID=UPI00126321E6|nr:protein FAR-RED IMPAIRED RESPONSE 1-like [Pistacia vera]
MLVEAGGPENLTFLQKDCRNYIEKVRRMRLGAGDVYAIQKYFLKMQKDNANFFYMMDLDDEDRLQNVIWVDARSMAAFKEFGDVVTFDTTYLTNKYDMPFAAFVGVDHHGHSTLLGCGLISHEDTETFVWLFESWLACMWNCAPNAIITDQDKAMQNAIEIVFLGTRHRWCLWHIMKKLPEKLRGYSEYERIKFALQNAMYDSLTREEFKQRWTGFIDKYNLHNNEWLLGLYNERQRWVPSFVKDTFWAEKEKEVDFRSWKSWIPCITGYPMEKQFQEAYTTTKFKEFQQELTAKLHCEISSFRATESEIEYIVKEVVMVGETCRSVPFVVCYDDRGCDVLCNCRLFEFRGIICRHAITVLLHKEIYHIPEKFILRRWRKNVYRCHTKIRVSYNSWSMTTEGEQFDQLSNSFSEVADLA